jgi:hypothetical protein
MAATAETIVASEARPEAAAVPVRLPWFLTAVLSAAAAVVSGLIWDIVWHRSIGRDTFWSPPHLAIYLGGIVAGVCSAWVIFRTTFAGSAEERARGVRVWGLTGPLGAFLCAWGGGAMLVSAPFDDWWHNAYGLDVRIISPPHFVLALGMNAILVGAMLTAAALQNGEALDAAGSRLRSRLRLSCVIAAGLLLTLVAIMTYEYLQRMLMHSSIFYVACACGMPFALAAAARAARVRWPATAAALVYTALWAAQVWIMPLFPAEPRLGPVRQPVTHMVPLQFPLLLVVPALAVDALLHRWKGRQGWTLAAALGTLFLAALLAVQWPFASFLLSPYSRNWFFATHEFPYFAGATSAAVRHRFYAWDASAGAFGRGLALAAVVATMSARLGLAWGGWISRVRR